MGFQFTVTYIFLIKEADCINSVDSEIGEWEIMVLK